MSETAHLLLEVRRLRADLDELRGDQRHLMRMLLAKEDRRAGAAMLPLLGDRMSEAGFAASDAWAQTLNDRSAEGQALRELIAEYFTEDGGLKAFGRFLARIEGVPLAGRRLELVDSPRGINRWRVVRVSGPE
jgi:hypothetical protein